MLSTIFAAITAAQAGALPIFYLSCASKLVFLSFRIPVLFCCGKQKVPSFYAGFRCAVKNYVNSA